MRGGSLWILILVGMLMLGAEASSSSNKKKKRLWKAVRRECMETHCAGKTELEPNCVPKCVSESCWRQIYEEDPLEPGQVDYPRNRKFEQCVGKEFQAQNLIGRNN
eukprot:gb/GEZN01025962.1/.p1 GENE.gb/GEZN01025962.1/~~gb/GEZN01025962.1/.p1  ORF type:complete len:106 (-),score=21.21 gb/GEZN01025962.1/:183-500(-)